MTDKESELQPLTKVERKDGYLKMDQEDNDLPDFVPTVKIEAQLKNKGAKGILYMAISSIAFSLMSFFLKKLYLRSDVTAYEVSYWQNLMQIVFYYTMMKLRNQDQFKVPKDLRISIIYMGLTGFLGITSYYLSVQYIDFSKAAVLYWTNPMATALLSYFWLKEAISFVDWVAIFCTFAGILFIQNPWVMWQKTAESGYIFQWTETLGTLSALFGAVFISISMMLTRKMGKRVHFLIPPFYQSMISSLICPFFMVWMIVFRDQGTTTYNLGDALLILLLSSLGFLAFIFQTKSYQIEKAGRVAPVAALQIIFNYVLDYALIGTKPKFNEIVGGMLIVGSSFVISLLRCLNLIR